MAQQAPQLGDLLKSMDTRINALESAQIDDDTPTDMFRLFLENTIAADTFRISTHAYHVCGPGTICSPTLIL